MLSAAAASSDSSANTLGTSIYSFGSGAFGCLGLGDDLSRSIPTLIPLLNGMQITKVVANGNVAGVVTNNGIYTWGLGTSGALGHGDCSVLSQPRLVDRFTGHHMIDLSMSETHSCALELLPNGQTRVWVFGNRALGLPTPPAPQSARGDSYRSPVASPLPTPVPTAFSSPIPIPLTALDGCNIRSIACGKHHTLALSENGDVFAFGADRNGALSLGLDAVTQQPIIEQQTPRNLSREVEILKGKKIKQIAAGNGSSYFLTDSGDVLASGNNEYGNLGCGSSTRRFYSPVPVKTLKRIKHIAAGAFHAAAVDEDGRVFTFGWNHQGQLAQGHRHMMNGIPLAVDFTNSGSSTSKNMNANRNVDPIRIQSVAAGFENTAFVSVTDRLYVSGKGRDGQLGRGNHTNESVARSTDVPLEVDQLTNNNLAVVQVACGSDFSIALVKKKGVEQK